MAWWRSASGASSPGAEVGEGELSAEARCDTPVDGVLSLWQVAKKGLWDYVRGPFMEGTAQLPMLVHVAWTLEQASLGASPQGPGFAQQCPVGLVCLRLLLLEVSGHDAETLAVWADALLLEAMRLSWPHVVRSEWPLFAQLHRFAMGEGRWPRVYEPSPQAALVGLVATALGPVEEAPPKRAERAAGSLRAVLGSSASARALGCALLVPEAGPLWSALAAAAEEQLAARALGPPGRAAGAARYFLRHLRSEFAGSAGAPGPFVESLLGELRAGRPGVRPSCWDVGAASFGEAPPPRREVWQACLALGAGVRAFEPSREGHARLAAAMGAAAERLALSNRTGRGWLIQGGLSTASLGRKGCGLWVVEEECGERGRWEAVNVTTVDALLGQASLDVLKVDAEGEDWAVAQGAARALGEGRIGLVVLEYGDKWSPELALAAKHMAAAHHEPGRPPREPSLRGAAAWFAARGYEGYLLGTRTPVPIAGPWWHDVYEACSAPHRPIYDGVGKVCWLDAVFAHRAHPLAALVRSRVRWASFGP